jgi:hypothetical protein
VKAQVSVLAISLIFLTICAIELTIPGDGTSFILVKYQANDTSDDILREARVVIEFPGVRLGDHVFS